ncbi:MAG: DUF3596 domain-containing protein [Melioribacteraceae bacterium]|nr:DUF3596 domain-containing protein [Melioribacteraceae bacterium]
MARIYKRGKTLWISYYHNGREYRESLHLKDSRENRSLAKRIMKKKEAEIVTGANPVIRKVKGKLLKSAMMNFKRAGRNKSYPSQP